MNGITPAEILGPDLLVVLAVVMLMFGGSQLSKTDTPPFE